ncbi:uncharacterized protein EI90DRAFT_3032868 [Cantharellus anzutake]|uniref:uncharacterized protein n=1 Tax=Cantharellus anzutake TaxID=1750568 RepID=UPI001903848E|nr:uncharacterized protein EI90DRAFT_3032868 [Cantharellus anzutake]KAF8342312.1 hypothetical protein EI90DRAFT_3032868 [Cantharellus anzutake]
MPLVSLCLYLSLGAKTMMQPLTISMQGDGYLVRRCRGPLQARPFHTEPPLPQHPRSPRSRRVARGNLLEKAFVPKLLCSQKSLRKEPRTRTPGPASLS